MTNQNPLLRASDVDRELVASQLGRHATAGRLTLDELDERLGGVYAAKTIGDLQKLTTDLPSLADQPADLIKHKSTADPRELRRRARADRRGVELSRPPGQYPVLGRVIWGSFLSVNLMLIVIWGIVAATGGAMYPWWLWVAGPWGAAIAARQIQRWAHPSGSGDPRHRPPA